MFSLTCCLLNYLNLKSINRWKFSCPHRKTLSCSETIFNTLRCLTTARRFKRYACTNKQNYRRSRYTSGLDACINAARVLRPIVPDCDAPSESSQLFGRCFEVITRESTEVASPRRGVCPKCLMSQEERKKRRFCLACVLGPFATCFSFF